MKDRSNLKALFIFLLFSFISLHFLLTAFHTSISFNGNYDSHLNLSLLSNCLKSLRSLDFNNIYHYPSYYPYSYVSVAGPLLIGQAILVLPLCLVGIENIYFLNNILVFLSFFLGGYSVYLLTKEISENDNTSIMAGIIFVLMPIKQQNLPHLNLLFICFSIFSILYIYRYLKENRKRDLMLFGLFYFIQALFDLSYFFMLSFMIPVIVIVYIFIIKRIPLCSLLSLTGMAIISAGTVAVVFYPYIANPLGFQYSQALFRYDNLLPSIALFTTRAMGHPKPTGDSIPMFLGFSACFTLSCFFYKKSDKKTAKALSVLLFLTLAAGFIILNYSSLDTGQRIEYADHGLIMISMVIVILLILCWKYLGKGEKFIFLMLAVSLIIFFQGIYRFIGFEINIFRFLSQYIGFFGRMRGPRMQLLFQSIWIISSVMGLSLLGKGRAKYKYMNAFYIIAVLLVIENFPGSVQVGRPEGFTINKKASYEYLEKYPDYYGVLELPYYNGGPREHIYELNTIFHDKQIYNSHFGVGIFDPLKIIRRGYLQGYNTMCTHLTDADVIKYLRDRGIYILVFHKDALIDMPSRMYKWEFLIKSLYRSLEMNLISDISIDEYCIIAVISPQESGDCFSYQLPYRYFRNKDKVVLTAENNYDDNDMNISLNKKDMMNIRLKKGSNRIEISLDSTRLFFKENYLELKSRKEITIKGFEQL